MRDVMYGVEPSTMRSSCSSQLGCQNGAPKREASTTMEVICCPPIACFTWFARSWIFGAPV